MPSLPAIPRCAALAGLAALLLGVPATGAAEEARTLVLVLDGVPHRVAERAVAQGAFEGWQPLTRMVAPFPSMTNVSLTLLLAPFGQLPTPGYELQHYDWERNEVHGGGAWEHRTSAVPWRRRVHVANRSLPEKFGTYARPRHHFWTDLERTRRAVLESEEPVILAHLGATDALQHVAGDEAVIPLLVGLDDWLRVLKARHAERRGAPLRVVLLSDHGNGCRKVRRVFGARKLLKRAGLRVRRRLEQPRDVVVATFGITGHAALYTAPEDRERAARALLAHPGIELAAWRSGERELRVLSSSGEARIRWRGEFGRLRLAHEARIGDPLRLAGAQAALERDGAFDGEGFASEERWLHATAAAPHPNAPARLVRALAGSHVVNRASVLLSLRPGFGWGWKSAAVFAWFRGGALEGTHGGLDQDASVGFLLADRPELWPGPVTTPSRALGCLDLEAGRVSTRPASTGGAPAFTVR